MKRARVLILALAASLVLIVTLAAVLLNREYDSRQLEEAVLAQGLAVEAEKELGKALVRLFGGDEDG